MATDLHEIRSSEACGELVSAGTPFTTKLPKREYAISIAIHLNVSADSAEGEIMTLLKKERTGTPKKEVGDFLRKMRGLTVTARELLQVHTDPILQMKVLFQQKI